MLLHLRCQYNNRRTGVILLNHELQQPEFMIFPNATLEALAKGKPRKMEELSGVKGLGPAKITKYGDDLMAILNAF